MYVSSHNKAKELLNIDLFYCETRSREYFTFDILEMLMMSHFHKYMEEMYAKQS